MDAGLKTPGAPAGRPGKPRCYALILTLRIDPSILQEPCANSSHGALVRGAQLLQRASRVEGREQLAVLFLGPRLSGLRRHLRLAPIEAVDPLERGGRFVQRAHHLRTLVRA